VMHPGSSERYRDGFCIFWKPGWETEVTSQVVSPRWWTSLQYSVHPRERVVVVHHLKGPDAVAVDGGGWQKMSSRAISYGGKDGQGVNARMYEQPRQEWPCSEQTWHVLMSQSFDDATGPSGGGRPSPHPRPNMGTDQGPPKPVINPCVYGGGQANRLCR
jgi:hypothetical protein